MRRCLHRCKVMHLGLLACFCLWVNISTGFDKHAAGTIDTLDFDNAQQLLSFAKERLTEKDLNSVDLLLKRSIEISEKKGDAECAALGYYYLADFFYYSQQYKEAMSVYRDNITRLEAISDTIYLIRTYNSLGILNNAREYSDEALNYFLKAVELADNFSNKSIETKREKLSLLININNAYLNDEQYEKVLEYSDEAIKIAEEINDSARLGSSLNTLGVSNERLGNSALAKEQYFEASTIFSNIGDQFRLAFVHTNIGELYQHSEKYDSALFFMQLSLEEFKQNNYEIGYLCAATNISRIYLKIGKLDDARKILTELIEKYDGKEYYKSMLNIYEVLSELESKQGNYKEAYSYQLKVDSLEQGIYTIEKQNVLAELQTKYETKLKENEIKSLKDEQAKQKTIIRLTRILSALGFSIAIVIMLFAINVFIRLKEKRKANIFLEEKNAHIEKQNIELQNLNKKLSQSEKDLRTANNAKNKFFSILGHDLRNPMHTILGQSYLLSKKYDKLDDNERISFATELHGASENIYNLIERLLEWSRCQQGGIRYNPQQLVLQDVVSDSVSLLGNAAKDKSIEIISNIDSSTHLFADPSILQTIIRNLLGNSIKFTRNGGRIIISSKEENGNVVISVADNGVGIAEDKIPTLFAIDSDTKTLGTNKEKGTGLGLPLCKEFVELHKGKIWVESKKDEGSTFYFSIPSEARL